MNGKRLAGAVLMSLVITLPVDQPLAQGPDVDLPVFEVEPSWPMLPNDWVLGQVASVTVGRSDQVWVLHRPRTVPEGSRGPKRIFTYPFDARSWR